MTIERLSRDGKSKRNGRSLRDTQIGTPDRLDRLLLVLAVAYALPCGLGVAAHKTHKPADWRSSSKAKCVFRIGLIMLVKIRAWPPHAFAAAFDLSETVAQHWG